MNHHAYIIEKVSDDGANSLAILNFISTILEIEKDPHSSPNFLHIKSNQLSIDDAGRIVAFNSQKSFGENGGGKKVAFIEINGAGHQAQNALLKTLEEPYPNTYFLITISSASLLLPTILSRVEAYSVASFFKKFGIIANALSALATSPTLDASSGPSDSSGSSKFTETKSTIDVKEFLSAKLSERMEIVKKIVSDAGKEGDDDSSKLFEFLRGIEIILKDFEKDASGSGAGMRVGRRLSKDELQTLINIREYFADNGASKKMLLEYLALKLPILKNL